jgi:hypothetical protein
MKRMRTILASFAVVAVLAACGGGGGGDQGDAQGGDGVETDGVTPPVDTVGGDDVQPFVCTKADDCTGRVNPGTCQVADCVDGACVAVAAPNGTTCDDGNACTTGDVCTAGACAGTMLPGCDPCNATADCAPFEDGDACNGTLVCAGGVCELDAATVVTCPAATDCAEYVCNAATGNCDMTAVNEGGLCENDAIVDCAVDLACLAGACVCPAEPCLDDQCGTRECGPSPSADPACADVSCGACPQGETCDVDGMCQPDVCQSQCGARQCGADPGCPGQFCGALGGACPQGETCNAQGMCQTVCVPQCQGRECGSDGCGGTCGECTGAGEVCVVATGLCVECTQDCGTAVCGVDPVCGASCGTCQVGGCVDGQCDPCFGVDDVGCCEDDIVLYCDGGVLASIDCGASGDVDLDSCGWNGEFGYYDCVAQPSADPAGAPRDCPVLECPTDCTAEGIECGLLPACPWIDCGGCSGTDVCTIDGQCDEGPVDPCQGVSFEGCCQADGTLLYCDPDMGLQFLDCADPESPGACGWDAEGGFYNCGGSGAEPTGTYPMDCPALDCGTCAGQGVECGPNPRCPWQDCGGCGDGQACIDGQCAFDRCLGVPGVGCCDDGVLYGCFQNTLISQTCADDGNVCGWYAGDFFTAPGYYCGPADILENEDPSGTYPAACDFGACVNAEFCAAAGYECGMGCPGESCGECGAGEVCGFDHQCHPLVCGAGNAGADAACGSGPTTVTGNTSAMANTVQNYPTCAPWEYNGPETWHEFTPSCDGPVTVSLSGPANQDLDLLVLVGECAGDAETCAGISAELGSVETVTFDAVVGTTYYIVVEGFDGAAGAYTLETFCPCACVQQCGTRECGPDPNCGVSCGTCDANELCTAEGVCETFEAIALTCDSLTAGSNVGAGSAVNGYSCSSWNENGPEVIYSFTATATEDVTISFNQNTATGGVPLTGDLDLFVIAGTFDPANCVTYGDTRLTLAAEAGQTYYIVVDGYGGATSDFVLAVDCATVCADPQCGERECGPAPGPFCAGFECQPGCAAGQICGADGMCGADPCQGVTYEGCCEGDAVVWCEGGALFAVHCGLEGISQPGCGWLESEGYYWCGGADTPPAELPLECPALTCETTCEAEGYACGQLPGCPWIWCGGCDGDNQICVEGGCRQDPCIGVSTLGCCDGSVLNYCTGAGLGTQDCGDDPCGWYGGDLITPAGFYCGASDTPPTGIDLACTFETCDNTQLCQDWGFECGPGCPGQECGTCGEGQVCNNGLCLTYTAKTCATPAAIACGDVVSSFNSAAENLLNGYACAASLSETAGEEVYALTLDADAEIQIDLTGLSADLDLFVLTGTCDPASCTNHSAGIRDERVTLTGTAGTTYYIVVDGYSGATSSYSLAVTCGTPCVPDCGALECGLDPLCGVECGPCGAGEQCNAGVCEAPEGLTCATPGTLACDGEVQGDTTTSPALMTAYGCSFFNQPGGEDVYELTGLEAGGTGMLVLSDLSADLDLLLFAVPDGGECGAAACIEYGDSSIEFEVEAGFTYYAVVDTYIAAQPSAYTLSLACTAGCDPACGANQECVDGTCIDLPTLSCVDATPITCAGGAVTGTTVGGSEAVERYSCTNWTESGPEVVYVFTAPADGSYTFQLSVDELIDLDLFVLGADCDPTTCLAHGDTAATFTATAGTTYYIVVDGYGGDEGSFVLTPVCE